MNISLEQQLSAMNINNNAKINDNQTPLDIEVIVGLFSTPNIINPWDVSRRINRSKVVANGKHILVRRNDDDCIVLVVCEESRAIITAKSSIEDLHKARFCFIELLCTVLGVPKPNEILPPIVILNIMATGRLGVDCPLEFYALAEDRHCVQKHLTPDEVDVGIIPIIEYDGGNLAVNNPSTTKVRVNLLLKVGRSVNFSLMVYEDGMYLLSGVQSMAMLHAANEVALKLLQVYTTNIDD